MPPTAADLLRQLTAGEENAVRTVLALAPEHAEAPAGELTPRVRTLVRLAALVALDAPTVSLRWAAERACCSGAGDEEIVAVLVAVGSDVGLARLVAAAPRLALALGYDSEVEGWDGS